jgi:hypothetical protein
VLKSCSRETAVQILMGGAHLYGFSEADFAKADAAAAARAGTNGGSAPAPKRRGAAVGG